MNADDAIRRPHIGLRETKEQTEQVTMGMGKHSSELLNHSSAIARMRLQTGRLTSR